MAPLRASTIETITENPIFYEEVLYSFVKADEIAQSGVAKDHYMRLRAGLIFTLMEAAMNEGHTYLPRTTLLEKALQIYGQTSLILIFAKDYSFLLTNYSKKTLKP